MRLIVYPNQATLGGLFPAEQKQLSIREELMCRISVIALAALVIITITPAQNGDRNESDSLSGINDNAGTLDPHDGANAAVPDSNKANSMGTFIFNSTMDAFNKAVTSKGAITFQPDSPGALVMIDGSIDGMYSGRVSAKGTALVSSITKTMFFDLILSFHNYSVEGGLFLGGEVHAEEIVNSVAPFAKTISYVVGNIRFNGARIGNNRFSDLFTASPANKMLSMTIISTIISDNRVFVHRDQE